MRKLLMIGAVLALGAGMMLPAQAETRSTAVQAKKYNFNSGRSMLSGRLNAQPARTTRGAAARKAAVRNGNRVRKAATRRNRAPVRTSRRAGYNACRNAARKFGVPVSTALAVCRVESGFRCSARGAAGELGLLQIKPATARSIGYRGPIRNLLRCSTGAYWGMKHLAMAIRRGGVWKHNAGLYAKRPNRMARKYARLVAATKRRYY